MYITFKKLAPNGHFFLDSVQVPQKKAKAIISENLHKNKGGWYTFDVRFNEVVVGYNLWDDLNF